jgi:effector-binding domain-containing protein
VTYDVHLAEVRRRPSAVVRAHVRTDDIADFVGGAFAEVMTVLDRQCLAPTGPPYSRYTMAEDGFEVESGFPTSGAVTASGGVVPSELPGGTVATTLHTGAYDEVGAAYAAADSWLAEHRMVAAGSPWECYLDGPEVAEPRTEVLVPCRAADA